VCYRAPASFLIGAALCTALCGCSRGLTAKQRQQWNHALTYFLYAQADAQLARANPRGFPRTNERVAREWVVDGLKLPERVVAESNIGGKLSFTPGIVTAGGNWDRKFEDNPKAKRADVFIQLFNDAPSTWDPRERLWHLPGEYHDDYELVRGDDHYQFFLAFYQDPFPDTTRD